MDEEDGRPGPRARKFGSADVLTDAFAGSLRNLVTAQTYPSLFSQFLSKSSAIPCSIDHPFTNHATPRLFSGVYLPKASAPAQVEEKQYENVPGK